MMMEMLWNPDSQIGEFSEIIYLIEITLDKMYNIKQ